MQKMKGLILIWMVGVFSWTYSAVAAESTPGATPPIPTPGMVTMVDLGANQCIPCKMMTPIIEELKKEYENRVSIIFIDVWKNPEMAQRFAVRGIPTQIFYGKDGVEFGRHMGFMDKKSIISAFEKLGVSR
jgi:thioredoxin 1